MAKRTQLEDGRWFDLEAVRGKWSESTTFDGRNNVSDATGSQWDHETLYLTSKKTWVLNHWSQWEGSVESYAEITADEASRWLTSQGQDVEDIAAKHEVPELVETLRETEA